MITKEDILNVSESLKIKLLDEEVQMILDVYEECQKDDPSATWNLVVEKQIYDVIEPRSHAIQEYNCPNCSWFGNMYLMINEKCPQCKTDIFIN